MDRNDDQLKQKLSQFSTDCLIGTNERSYNIGEWGNRKISDTSRDYTLQQVEDIIESGDIDTQIELSRNYFRKDGLYKRILLHYATILTYSGLLVPSPSYGKDLSEDYIKKRYFKAINFVESVGLSNLMFEWTLTALRDGCFYGVVQYIDDTTLSVLTLPAKYCASRFKDACGNDVIEFDVSYFDSLTDKDQQRAAFKVFPKEAVNWYRRYKKGKVRSKWVYISTENSICLPFLDGHPNFLHVIPAVINYEDAVETDKERDLEETSVWNISTVCPC